MMATRPKVVRVEIEYADGKVLRQTGDAAEQIWQHVESAEVMNWVHGGRYSGPTLEEVK